MGLFDWRRLTPEHMLADAAEPIDDPLYGVLAAALTVMFGATVFARLLGDAVVPAGSGVALSVARAATVAGWLAAIGLVVLLFRWQPVPFLSKRVWFYAWWLAVAVASARAAWIARRRGVAA